MKAKSIQITVIVALLITGLGYIYWNIQKQEKYISENCPGYKIIPSSFVDTAYFIDCSNSIAIEQWDGDKYLEVSNFSIISNMYHDQLIARIDDYVIENNYLYFIENPSTNVVNYGEKCNNQDCSSKTKFMIYYLNGEKQIVNFTDKSEIPLFRKVNTITGEFTFYQSINDTPEPERFIFERLMTNRSKI